jgi:hypothetical protein
MGSFYRLVILIAKYLMKFVFALAGGNCMLDFILTYTNCRLLLIMRLWEPSTETSDMLRTSKFRRPVNGIRAFDSGTGEHVMEWCLSSSSLRQKSCVKVEHS